MRKTGIRALSSAEKPTAKRTAIRGATGIWNCSKKITATHPRFSGNAQL